MCEKKVRNLQPQQKNCKSESLEESYLLPHFQESICRKESQQVETMNATKSPILPSQVQVQPSNSNVQTKTL